MKNVVEGISRVLLSSPFIYLSLVMLVHPGRILDQLVSSGLPLVPVLFIVILSSLLIGSITLFLGYRTQSAAVLLILISVPAALLMFPAGSVLTLPELFCWVGIIGGLLHVALSQPGAFSLDQRYNRPVRKRR